MAAQIYLITKAGADAPEKTNVDDIHACIMNLDDGDAESVHVEEAVTAVEALGHPVGTGYFTTEQLLGPPTAGIMTTDQDIILILRRTKEEAIA